MTEPGRERVKGVAIVLAVLVVCVFVVPALLCCGLGRAGIGPHWGP